MMTQSKRLTFQICLWVSILSVHTSVFKGVGETLLSLSFRFPSVNNLGKKIFFEFLEAFCCISTFFPWAQVCLYELLVKPPGWTEHLYFTVFACVVFFFVYLFVPPHHHTRAFMSVLTPASAHRVCVRRVYELLWTRAAVLMTPETLRSTCTLSLRLRESFHSLDPDLYNLHSSTLTLILYKQ